MVWPRLLHCSSLGWLGLHKVFHLGHVCVSCGALQSIRDDSQYQNTGGCKYTPKSMPRSGFHQLSCSCFQLARSYWLLNLTFQISSVAVCSSMYMEREGKLKSIEFKSPNEMFLKYLSSEYMITRHQDQGQKY